jgi:hypothetical protein
MTAYELIVIIFILFLGLVLVGFYINSRSAKPSLKITSEEEYKLLYSIFKDWIIFLPKYNQQLALKLTWEKELYKAKLSDIKERTQSLKELELGVAYNEKVRTALLDDFWQKHGGYKQDYDPNNISLKHWPADLRKSYHHNIHRHDINKIDELAKNVLLLKGKVMANKSDLKNNSGSKILPPLGEV